VTRERALVAELMDDPGLDPDEHRRALAGLARLNAASMIDRVVWREIESVSRGAAMCVLDVAAGSGDLAVALACRAERSGRAHRFACTDISPVACGRIGERARSAGIEIQTTTADVIADGIDGVHDIVMCHLFLHHLREDQITRLLASMRGAARRAVIVTDLVRTNLGYALALIASRALTRSRVVHTDALRSVRAALSPHELAGIARDAGLGDARVRRVWPERMMLTWCPER